jgi:maltose phosphorylase
MSDITIEGDVKAQQGIRFQYLSTKPNLLGKRQPIEYWTKRIYQKSTEGSTYWDNGGLYSIWLQRPTSCSKFIDIPLQPVGENIENAQNNLGFKTGSSLYPMVTMNGKNATMKGNHT